ncbi:hypothetical protein NST89_02525 [Caldifermentibacillus hisashii]|uniref:hypothetical protein n=1 Tax=Caldifermentibacillus hisashii TaxID=996558 RepID=UPI0031361BFD
MVTRTGLAAKIELFPTQNGDENGSRRQNRAFFTPKWRRKRVHRFIGFPWYNT